MVHKLLLCGRHNLKSSYTINDNEVTSLKLWNENMFHTYWDRDRNNINEEDIDGFKMVLAHDSQINNQLIEEFTSRESYFKLIHNHKEITDIEIPSGYYIRNVNFDLEMQIVSDLICRCYENIKPSIEEVTKWINHSVFKKNLWVWIIDKSTEQPVGLGIAELDRNIKEGVLEWIQVLPEYHGKGLGKIIVIELLKRLKPYAEFTTVSGQIDNKTNPERLYKRCGFTGDDIWHVLRK